MTDQISSIPLTKEQAYALVDAVMERDDLALTASAHEDEETGEWIFEATSDCEPNVAAFEALARAVLGGEIGFAVEEVDPDVDWVGRSLAGLKPVTAGGFYVYGSHETAPPPTRLIPIHIDAAQAFGTGHHETTTGCLEAIELVLKHRHPANVIDIGTGTGVLAIAAAKRLRQTIGATDIDPVAVDTARDNAVANGVGRFIRPIVATGLDHPAITMAAPYDLLIANILAGPLIQLAPAIGRAVAPGGDVILSGLLETQARRVIAAYAREGMVLRRKLTRKAWSTLILTKKAPSKKLVLRRG